MQLTAQLPTSTLSRLSLDSSWLTLSTDAEGTDNDSVQSPVRPRQQMSLFSDSMDELLPHLLSFPPHPPPPQPLSNVDYDRHIRGLVQTLNQVAASKLTSGVSGGGDLLDVRAVGS